MFLCQFQKREENNFKYCIQNPPTQLFVIDNIANQKPLTCSASSVCCPSWGSFPRLRPGLFPLGINNIGWIVAKQSVRGKNKHFSQDSFFKRHAYLGDRHLSIVCPAVLVVLLSLMLSFRDFRLQKFEMMRRGEGIFFL